MLIEKSRILGLRLVTPRPIRDERGWFMRTYSADEHGSADMPVESFVQENQSRSRKGTIRGLHTRAELREAKLVRVPHGRIFDVVVDLRPTSPTFLQWESFILDDEEHRQLLVPAGCGHGFQALSDEATVCYKVDAPYDPALDVAVAWNDPELAIDWPLADPLVSARDQAAPALAEVKNRLGDWFGKYSVHAG
ncbi:dTDP-4-dehydrorhamnose 3,5-epimerase [Streptomyces anulatus]|uniref:dTDP-4-dehydrorhamnose 3,5-epimerase n=1 Tax=Streptomyces anulatus TaxID=1892 RepID=UPI0034322999